MLMHKQINMSVMAEEKKFRGHPNLKKGIIFHAVFPWQEETCIEKYIM